MTDTKFTPGPWKVLGNRIDRRGCDGIVTEDVRLAVWSDDPEDAEATRIVETDSGAYPPLIHDAYLIAAAPELYAALDELSGLGGVPERMWKPAAERAIAALAKARGEAAK